jgi:hypothetical protein
MVRWVGGLFRKSDGGLGADDARPGEQAASVTNMKILDVPQSGKWGNSVSVRTRYGQSRRPLVIPKDPKTPAQLRSRSTLGQIAPCWRGLTDEQRIAWTEGGRKLHSRPRLGQSGPLTGCQFFTMLNCNLASIGLERIVLPTERTTFSANPVDMLVITNTGGEIDFKLVVRSTPVPYTIVLGTAPCSAGISYATHFVILGLLSAPEAGFSNIRKLYVDMFGVPPVGKRVFIRTRQQINGWEDLPKQTTAIVPAP